MVRSLLPLAMAGCLLATDDLDRDGFGAAEDCDDRDPAVNPGESDVPLDGVDQDCNGGDTVERAIGELHECDLIEGGAVVCSGDDSLGQLEAPAGSYVAVVAGDWHTCALTATGVAVCWGDDTYGQASPPKNGGPYIEIGAGPDFSWGREDHGDWLVTRCWGRCGKPVAVGTTGPAD